MCWGVTRLESSGNIGRLSKDQQPIPNQKNAITLENFVKSKIQPGTASLRLGNGFRNEGDGSLIDVLAPKPELSTKRL